MRVSRLSAIMAKSDLNSDAYVAEHGEAAYVELVAAYALYIGIASIVLLLLVGKVAKSVPSQFDLVSSGDVLLGSWFQLCRMDSLYIQSIETTGLIWYDATWRRMDWLQ
jgi:hypothetical protein